MGFPLMGKPRFQNFQLCGGASTSLLVNFMFWIISNASVLSGRQYPSLLAAMSSGFTPSFGPTMEETDACSKQNGHEDKALLGGWADHLSVDRTWLNSFPLRYP